MSNTQNKGLETYDRFATQFGYPYQTPVDQTLELFALLDEKGLGDILLFEMMQEYLTNYNSFKLRVRNRKIYGLVPEEVPLNQLYKL